MMTVSKRKSYLKGNALFTYIRGMKQNFRNMFMNCKRFCWTHTFMLECRSNAMVGNWERLTACDQAELFGYWEALHDNLMDELECRYLINGKWYLPKDVADHDRSGCSYENYHYVHTKHTDNGPEYVSYT